MYLLNSDSLLRHQALKASSIDTRQVCTKENHFYTFNHNVSAPSTPTFCLPVKRLGVSIVEDQIHCSHTHYGNKDDRNAISARLRLLKVKSPKEQLGCCSLYYMKHGGRLISLPL